jgi:hypothetical protein
MRVTVEHDNMQHKINITFSFSEHKWQDFIFSRYGIRSRLAGFNRIDPVGEAIYQIRDFYLWLKGAAPVQKVTVDVIEDPQPQLPPAT